MTAFDDMQFKSIYKSMIRKERFIAIFWVLLGFVICYRSFSMSLGRLNRPGPGFMPFITGLMIALLGFILLITSLFKKGRETEKEIQFNFRFYPLVPTLLILVAYSILINWFGYLISTYLLMFTLFSLSGKKMKWWFKAGIAILITLATYLLFVVWLRCSLPKGVFGV